MPSRAAQIITKSPTVVLGWVKYKRREQMLVMTLVERGGRARSIKVNDLTSKSLRDMLVVNASRKSALHTDELSAYK